MKRDFKFYLPHSVVTAEINLFTIGNRLKKIPLTKKGMFWVAQIDIERPYIEYNINAFDANGNISFYHDPFKQEKNFIINQNNNQLSLIIFRNNSKHLSIINYRGMNYLFIKILYQTEINFIQVNINERLEEFRLAPNSNCWIKLLPLDQIGIKTLSIAVKSSDQFLYLNDIGAFPTKDLFYLSVDQIDTVTIDPMPLTLGKIVNWKSKDLKFAKTAKRVWISSIFKADNYNGYSWLDLHSYQFKGIPLSSPFSLFEDAEQTIIDLPVSHCSKSSEIFNTNKDWYNHTDYKANAQFPELNLKNENYINYVINAISKIIHYKKAVAFRIDSAPRVSSEFINKLATSFPDHSFYYESWNTPRDDLHENCFEQDNLIGQEIRHLIITYQHNINYHNIMYFFNQYFSKKSVRQNLNCLYSITNQDFDSLDQNAKYVEFFYFILIMANGSLYLDESEHSTKNNSILSALSSLQDYLTDLQIGFFIPRFSYTSSGFEVELIAPNQAFTFVISEKEKMQYNIIANSKYYAIGVK